MSADKIRKVVVIGSGPAGYTAAIYAARGAAEPLLIEGNEIGGQLMSTTDIENFPGFAEPISGQLLMDNMHQQAKRVGVEVLSEVVNRLDLSQRPFRVITDSTEILAKTIIVATGARARYLGLESEQKFIGRGVSACATCDGFFYRNKVVAVVGGGDTACEEATYLTNHATRVFLIHRRNELRASRIMAQRLLSNPRIEPVWEHVIEEVTGDDSGVTGIRVRHVNTGEIREISLDGLFVAIGHTPISAFAGGQLALNENGFIVTVPGTCETSVEGVFAAGDVRDPIYRQAVTAAGTGCMAAMEAMRFLEQQE